jgi:hypothetical protein
MSQTVSDCLRLSETEIDKRENDYHTRRTPIPLGPMWYIQSSHKQESVNKIMLCLNVKSSRFFTLKTRSGYHSHHAAEMYFVFSARLSLVIYKTIP